MDHDFTIDDDSYLWAQNDRADQWISKNIPDNPISYGGASIIEHGCVDTIIKSIEDAGLTVAKLN